MSSTNKATEAPAAADMSYYCLVPVSFDTTTSRLSLPDGSSIPITERIKKELLLSTEEAEGVRPGITHRDNSHLASLLTFRQEDQNDEAIDDDVLAPPVVSPDSEINKSQSQSASRDLSGPKKSLFRSSEKSSNGSKVLDVEVAEAPPGKIQCIDLCDSSDDDLDYDDDEEKGASAPKRLCASTRKKKRNRGGTKRPKKRTKRKARYTLSAPGFSSEEDGHESDSTFEGSEDTAAAAQSEEEGLGPILRPVSIRRARLKYGKGRGDDSSEGSSGNDDDDDDDDKDDDDNDDDDDEQAGLLTSDDNASSDAIDVQLFCSWCEEYHNKDDFSLHQQANCNDGNRYCLLHHNVGYQTKYEGTSSVRKFSSQLDRISEKYKDVGSDDEIIGGSESDDDEGDAVEDNDNVSKCEETPKAAPTRMRRIKRRAEDLLDEESDSDEDDFGEEENEHLHTQPPHILQDEDDGGMDKERNAGHSKPHRRIIHDD